MPITPNPVPPVVTTSAEVIPLLSLAIPETGCAKSVKYFSVCCCIKSSNASSAILVNLSEESICVTKFKVVAVFKLPPTFDLRPVDTVIINFVRYFKEADGCITTTLSPLLYVALKETEVLFASAKEKLLFTEA